jgi:hypothetical protein
MCIINLLKKNYYKNYQALNMLEQLCNNQIQISVHQSVINHGDDFDNKKIACRIDYLEY